MRRLFKFAAVLFVLELVACLGIFAPALAAGTSITSINPTSGAVGSTAIVTGAATTGDIVIINFDGTAAGTSSAAVANVYTATITVPNTVVGAHIISIAGSSPLISTTFTVTPQITLSRVSGTTGNSVTVYGTGFAASSNINIKFNSVTQINNGSSDTSGSFSITFAIPAAATGTYSIVATDASLNSQTASFINTVTPTITINKSTGYSPNIITVSGTGFAAGESSVKVTFSGAQVGTTTANTSGAWSLNFAVPETPAGAYVIGASGASTLASAVATLAFTVTPYITQSKSSGINGAVILINGTGFAANEAVTINWDSAAVSSAPATADDKGSWNVSINVPVTASGVHNITASGATTAASSTNVLHYTVTPTININKASGTIGTTVTVNGNGFGANETGITATIDGTAVGTPATADANGVWSTTFTIPASRGGIHSIGAKGATTALASVPVAAFSIQASISSDKPGGVAGTSLKISGAGFAANEPSIVILYDDTPVTTGAITADANGTWNQTIIIPTSSAGTHTIKAKGSITPIVSAGDTNFKISPTFAITPTTGFVGTTVTITGGGFAGTSALTFSYDGNAMGIVQATTDESGNFSKGFVIPKSIAGNHVIKVTDASNNTYTQTFVMDSTAPATPNPISPADGSKQGLTGNITPDFKWTAVTSQSGVSYNLQIDTDSAFPHPLLNKTGLTSTHYTLTQTEALPKGQYYWRVQAVDNASNMSAWSQPLTLNSGMISSGMLTLLIILAVLIVIAAIYFLAIAPSQKKKKLATVPSAPAPATAPEIVIPEMINAEFRSSDSDDPTRRKALPWRLALPAPVQQAKGKTFSPEEQARLKVAIDFAKSLPLLECGNNTEWLIELVNNDGATPAPEIYRQLLNGQIQAHYEPAWMRHPTFNDLQDLLEGQAVLQDLNSFMDAVNRTAVEASGLLQSIYKETTAELGGDILENSGWGFVSGVYTDSVSWFLGKYLREPSDRDYSIKQEDGITGLYGAQNTPFEGLLVQVPGDKEAAQMRVLHLKLRRSYRNNDKSKQMASLLTQLDVQRSRLLTAFSQLSKLNT